jgi:hypothetical protein
MPGIPFRTPARGVPAPDSRFQTIPAWSVPDAQANVACFHPATSEQERHAGKKMFVDWQKTRKVMAALCI